MRATNYFKVIDDVGSVFFTFNRDTVEEAWQQALEYKRGTEGGKRRDANGEPIRPSRIVVWRRPPDPRWAHVREVGEFEPGFNPDRQPFGTGRGMPS